MPGRQKVQFSVTLKCIKQCLLPDLNHLGKFYSAIELAHTECDQPCKFEVVKHTIFEHCVPTAKTRCTWQERHNIPYLVY